MRKSAGVGSPCGRWASTMRRFFVGVAPSACPASSVAPTASEPAAMKFLRVCMAVPQRIVGPTLSLWLAAESGFSLMLRVPRDRALPGNPAGHSLSRPAAVEGDALTRDVARRRAQQEIDRAGQLVEPDELPLRHRLQHDFLD